jgi:hypothetical protein
MWVGALRANVFSVRTDGVVLELSIPCYVIFKGFPDASSLNEAKNLFSSVRHTPVILGDDSLDIGAYIEWANQIDEDLICVLNTPSEILAEDWLRKLAVNLALPNVGLVGATGSHESRNELKRSSPVFPNPHIRLSYYEGVGIHESINPRWRPRYAY